MRIERIESIESLIKSANQVHLTVYLENRGDLAELKHRLIESIVEADLCLRGAFGDLERRAFLAPLRALLDDAGVLSRIKGNIGLFRTRSDFRVLNIPVEVRSSCHVASTFHVKPLLKWMQGDVGFLILGLGSDSAHLYWGGQNSLRKLDSFSYCARMTELLGQREPLERGEAIELGLLARRTALIVGDCIEEMSTVGGLKLFLVGEERLTDLFGEGLGLTRGVRTIVGPSFVPTAAQEVAEHVRGHARLEARERLEGALLTFRVADDLRLARKSLREIAKAASEGKVKKLLVAENREVYGKLDTRRGKVVIHPFDMDHEDDDLLDDLAQCVLISGGQVYLAKKEEIPAQRLALAILDEESGPVDARGALPRAFAGTR